MRRRVLAPALVTIGLARLAAAQSSPAPAEPSAAPASLVASDDTPPLGVLPDHLIDPRMGRSWATLPARPFVATTVDVGFVYLRPRVSFGYGKPFTSWVGVEANPLIQTAGFGAYGGVRLVLPYMDFRLGSRYFSSFPRSYLPPATTYTRVDLDRDTGSHAHLVTHEAELTANLPVGPGDLLFLGSASLVTGVPTDQAVFEETLHVIVKGPAVWRTRFGYAIRFGSARQHSLGLVAEALDVPQRDDSLTLRAGPVVRMVLSRRVEVRGSFVMTVVSPDSIGLVGGDFTELGVRYRWASE